MINFWKRLPDRSKWMFSAKCLSFAVSKMLQQLGIICLLLSPCYAETEYRSVLIPIVDGVVGDPLVTRYRGPVSAEQIGLVANNSTEAIREANTAALQAAAAASVASGISLPPIQFGAGAYHFEDTLDVENALYRNGFRSARIYGACGSHYAAQHLVNKGYTPLATKLVAWGLEEGEFWWRERGTNDVEGVRTPLGQTNEPCNISIEDFVCEIPTGQQGSFFQFGDPEYDSDQAIWRGLHLKNLYGTHVEHFIRASGTNIFLENTADGYVLPAYRPTFIQISNIYDCELEKISHRGWFEGVLLENCDSPQIFGLRALNSVRDLVVAPSSQGDAWDVNAWKSRDGVPGRISKLYRESCPVGSVILSGIVHEKRDEFGYSTIPCNLEAHAAMPSGTTWSIGVGGTYIQIADLPEGRTVWDYFLAYTALELTPIIPTGDALIGTMNPADAEDTLEAGDIHPYQPQRTVMITQVDAANDRLYFHDADNSQYVPTAISGDAGSMRRLWAASILGGKRSSFSGISVDNNNEATLNVPKLCFVPYNNMIDCFGYSASGLGEDPQDLPNHRPRILMASAGSGSAFNGGVNWFGSDKQPNHPRAYCVSPGKSPSNWFAPRFLERDRFDLVFDVGTGDMSSNNFGREALFHPLVEEDGRPAWGYKMSDCPAAWPLKPLRTDPETGNVRACTVTARIYLDAAMNAQASNTVTLYDGSTSHNTPVTGLGVGWHDITWVKDGVTAPASANLYLLQGATRNVFVEYLGINWE